MNINSDLPYITQDLPGIGGKLRKNPEHFVVEELSLYEPQGKGQHLYVNLTKENLTTRQVRQQLASLFDVKNRDVGFAGLKDKYARSTQTFSVLVGHVDKNFVNQAVKKINDNLPVVAHWAKLHKNKLKSGHLLGNRFNINITELDISDSEALCRANAIADRLIEKGLPNFFGHQRFGSDGDNVQNALEIIKGKRHINDQWLKRFLVSSYQSYLCNLYLVRRVNSGAFDYIIKGDIAKKYDTGGMFEVESVEAEQPRYEAHKISFTAPIYGPKMWKAKDAAGKLEEEILAESDITMEELERMKVSGSRRIGRILTDIDAEITSKGLNVSFVLPKGAYATTVMREIMKVDLSKTKNESR